MIKDFFRSETPGKPKISWAYEASYTWDTSLRIMQEVQRLGGTVQLTLVDKSEDYTPKNYQPHQALPLVKSRYVWFPGIQNLSNDELYNAISEVVTFRQALQARNDVACHYWYKFADTAAPAVRHLRIYYDSSAGYVPTFVIGAHGEYVPGKEQSAEVFLLRFLH